MLFIRRKVILIYSPRDKFMEDVVYFANFSPLFESIPDALIILDDTGHIVFANQRATELFGYECDELTGEIIKKLLPIKFQNKQKEIVNSVIELYGIKKNHTEFPVEISTNKIKIKKNNFSILSVKDISERKKVEDANALLSAIVEFGDDAIIGEGLNGIIFSWNNGAKNLYGYSAQEIMGESIGLIFPLNQKSELEYVTQQIQKGKHIKTYETLNVDKYGKIFPVAVTLSPIKNTRNQVIGISITARDISKQKHLEEQLRINNMKLAHANLAKDHFLANMSHELRTPLNVIIGFTGILLMKLPGPLNKEQESQLKAVRSSTRHLLSLINDVLDVAKIESGKIDVFFEKIDCNTIIKNVASSLAPLAASKKIELKINTPTSKLYGCTDKRLLTQILINLANNAIKFTEKGYVEMVAKMKKNKKNKFILIQVNDTGIGIKKEERKKLFKAFEQLKIPRKHTEGTGLGLYLSKKLADSIKAKIGLTNKEGIGSQFYILIPTKRPLNDNKNSYNRR